MVVEKQIILHWYESNVYSIIQGGVSIAELSRKTDIKYHHLYKTYRETKDKIDNKTHVLC